MSNSSSVSSGSASGAAENQLDFQALVKRCMGATELAAQILRAFIARFMPEYDRLKALLIDGDDAGAAALCHKLRGSAANIEARQLSSLFGEVEGSLQRGDEFAARQQLARIKAAFDQLQAGAASLVGGLADGGAGT